MQGLNSVIPGKGGFLPNFEEPNSEGHGSATPAVVGPTPY